MSEYMPEALADITKRRYKQELTEWNFKGLQKELLVQDAQLDLDNELWVQEIWLGDINNFVDREEKFYFHKIEVFEEVLEETISKQSNLYYYFYDNGIILGRFVLESEYYNHSEIMTSLHKTFELCCKCGIILFPSNIQRKAKYYETITFDCGEHYENKDHPKGKLQWLMHGEFFKEF